MRPTDSGKILDLRPFYSQKYMNKLHDCRRSSNHSPTRLTLSNNTKKLVKQIGKASKIKLDDKINHSVQLSTEEQLDNEIELLIKNIQLVA